jgi:flagellin
MRINHNLNALNAWRNLGNANNAMGKSLEKLSSGLRINRAGDDAAGLSISEKMRAQIRGLDQGTRNAQDGISLIQTAEGALTETHSMLQRMRELAVQSANDTNTDADRGALQDEISQLKNEIDRIANTTNFNDKKLLNGDMGLKTASSDDTVFEITVTSDDNAALLDAEDNLITGASINITAATGGSLSVSDGTDTENFSFTIDDLGGVENLASISATSVTVANDTNITLDGIGVITIKAGTEIGSITSGSALSTTDIDFTELNGTDFQISEDNRSTLKIGANAGDAENMKVMVNNMDTASLNLTDISVSTQEDSESAIASLDNAIQSVSKQRSKLGAVQNRLEHSINNLSVASENLTAAESRIRDVDMAREMMSFTKNQILLQSSNAMLAQSNQIPQNVLSLLR